jgi:hypothetical protein
MVRAERAEMSPICGRRYCADFVELFAKREEEGVLGLTCEYQRSSNWLMQFENRADCVEAPGGNSMLAEVLKPCRPLFRNEESVRKHRQIIGAVGDRGVGSWPLHPFMLNSTPASSRPRPG